MNVLSETDTPSSMIEHLDKSIEAYDEIIAIRERGLKKNRFGTYNVPLHGEQTQKHSCFLFLLF